jgi:rhamnosyltransferase
MTRIPTLSDVRIIIPVRNGGERWREAANALLRCVPRTSMVAVVDSGSEDGSDRIAGQMGYEVERIDPHSFNHGGTRQYAVDRLCKNKAFVVFLTHDAVIDKPESLIDLLSAFEDPSTGAAYGRQLPHHNARPFARHNAAYLYPPHNNIRAIADAARYGLRTTHLSNSYAAYRVQALYECGGFPKTLILGEDAHVALRMLQAGWKISYRAGATVRHSHNYSVFQELQRYFDYGVFHAQMPELLLELGSAEGEGMRFLKSELKFMAATAPWLIPWIPVRSVAKYLGYRLGRAYERLPMSVRVRLSMTRGYWDSNLDGIE